MTPEQTARRLAEMAGSKYLTLWDLYGSALWGIIKIADRLKEMGEIVEWALYSAEGAPYALVEKNGDHTEYTARVIDGNYAAALIEALGKAVLEENA